MSFFSTIGSPERSPSDRDRSAAQRSARLPDDHDAGAALPRHLLVSLDGISADVASLQQRCVDDPQHSAALETILRRLDDLIDSIYEAAAGLAPPSVHG